VAEGEVVGAIEISGAIRSRADVVRVLDNICEYYTANEPSSPIPLLLRRAQRLVEKSFMEILADIVPDSVNQARIVSGKTDSS
jgi:type VI secretion system protein ImpA